MFCLRVYLIAFGFAVNVGQLVFAFGMHFIERSQTGMTYIALR